jgi:hypothetical protein
MRGDAKFQALKDKCFIDVVQDDIFFTRTKEEELATA